MTRASPAGWLGTRGINTRKKHIKLGGVDNILENILEFIYYINNMNLDFLGFSNEKSDKKRLIIAGAIIVIFLILVGWYFYNQKKMETKRPLTKEEKMKILESLKVPTEEELPEKERMKILKSLVTPTEKELPEKGRMRILESLTP